MRNEITKRPMSVIPVVGYKGPTQYGGWLTCNVRDSGFWYFTNSIYNNDYNINIGLQHLSMHRRDDQDPTLYAYSLGWSSFSYFQIPLPVNGFLKRPGIFRKVIWSTQHPNQLKRQDYKNIIYGMLSDWNNEFKGDIILGVQLVGIKNEYIETRTYSMLLMFLDRLERYGTFHP